jgi:hypothetical protein
MDILPLDKGLFDRAEKLGIAKIVLNFSGGSDEGYLNVEIYPSDEVMKESGCNHSWEWRTKGLSDNDRKKIDQLNSDIEEWAWENYSYSGAGDGSSYGDDVEYDLVEKKATISEWWYERTQGDDVEYPFQVSVEDENGWGTHTVETLEKPE